MLKLSQPQKLMIILLIAFIFILPFTNFLGSSGSVISQSSVKLSDEYKNDKLYTISLITLDDSGTQLTYLGVGATKTLADGTKIVPQNKETFNIKAENPQCKYQLKANPIKNPINGDILFNYYTFNSAVSRNQYVTVGNNYGKIVKVDVYYPKEEILPDSDGIGFANVKPQGTLQGEKDCIDEINDKIIVADKSGVPVVLQATAWQQEIALKVASYCTNPLFYLTGDCQKQIENLRYGINLPSQLYSSGWDVYTTKTLNPTNAESKTEFVGTINKGGIPLILISADEDYFESIRYSAGSDIVTPEIISFSQNEAKEETITSYLLIVKNPSLSEKTFNAKITTKYGTLSQTTYQMKIGGGQEYKQTIIYSAPSVTSKVDEIFTIEVCDNWQVPSASKCSVITEKRAIINQETIIPIPVKHCGDNICSAEIGENKNSCPQDCGNEPTPTPTSCKEIENSIYSSDAKDCVCSVGFDTKYNPNTGKMYCEKPQDIYGLVLVILGALILGVVVYTTLIKKGKKLMEEFKNMRDMSELKALSRISLERPLNDMEYKRMIELGKKAGLVRDKRYKIQKR